MAKTSGVKFKIGIVGLGLIGGSIFKSLNKEKYDVLAVSKSQKGKNITSDFSLLKDCDIIFVCSKMSDVASILDKLEAILPNTAIVCDVCSIKNFLKHSYSYNFIMSHPMAGTEKSGFKASFKGLFEGAKWVISEKNKKLEKIIKDLGAKPVLMNAKDHDEATALISHMPTLLAFSLFDMIQEDKNAQILAASGFRDMTRLAMTNSALIEDMLELNRENIDKAIKKMENSLNKIKNLSYNKRVELFKELAQKRCKMYKNGKNKLN